jgi:hypothetical protein
VGSPRFFISYVHDSGEDDEHVATFYRDLNHDVLMFAETGGFCDATLQLGQRWDPALVEALSTAQVFIPLLSPAYFRSPACGREWWIFASRMVRPSPSSFIVPLLWVPMRVPAIAQQYQYREAAFGPEYEKVKLRALLREQRRRDDYTAFVQLLAQRVTELSEGNPLPPATGRPGFDNVRSAFDADLPPVIHLPEPRDGPDPDARPILNPNIVLEEPR